MKFKDILELLTNIHKSNSSISQPFLCGGIPRSKYMGDLKEINDIDITTGDNTVQYLAQEFIENLSKNNNITSKKANDGHVSVYTGNIKIDFSSNFNVPDIENILKNKDIKNITSMDKEIFSRDFTCNSLLMPLDLESIIDRTHQGISDIDKKVLNTCLDVETTLKYNINRIIRAIYLSSKLGFSVNEEIIGWINKNKELVAKIDPPYIQKNIEKAISYNKENTIDLLNKTDLWNLLPMTEIIYPLYSQYTKKTAQLFRNFDYGEDAPSGPGLSFYSELGKYKSVSDWRKARRKRRKKLLKNIRDMKFK